MPGSVLGVAASAYALDLSLLSARCPADFMFEGQSRAATGPGAIEARPLGNRALQRAKGSLPNLEATTPLCEWAPLLFALGLADFIS